MPFSERALSKSAGKRGFVGISLYSRGRFTARTWNFAMKLTGIRVVANAAVLLHHFEAESRV